MNKRCIVMLATVVLLSSIFGQDLPQEELMIQREKVDYWQIGKEASRVEFIPKHTAPMGCISGVLLGPVGWVIGYGLITKIGGRGVSIPSDHIVGLTDQERESFTKGYKEVVMKKRRRVFNISAAIGTSVFVFFVTEYPHLFFW